MRNVGIVIVTAGVLLGFALLHRHGSHVGLPVTSAVHPLAPEFSVTTIDGQKVSLTDYRGKVVLLDFWATWCVPCRDEIPHFVLLQDKYRADGLQIIGISMDDGVTPVRQFYRDFHMNYPVALGGAKLGELYGGVLGLPIAFLIGRDGHILSKHIGAMPPATIDQEVMRALRRERIQ